MEHDARGAGRICAVLEDGERHMEMDDAVGRGAPFGEAREIVDQPRQRPLHAGEGRRGRHQAAQRNLAAKVARQRHEQRHDGREIGQRAGEQREIALALGLDVPGGAQLEQRAAQPQALVRLAMHQRDAFGVLACPGEAGAEIGFAALAHIAGMDQAAPEQIGERRADHGIGHGAPHHVAWQVELEAKDLDRQRTRQDPEDAQEGEELQHTLQQALRELDGELG